MIPAYAVRGRERGSATLYALFALLLLTSVCVVGVQFVALARVQHKAAGAADLAALAGSRAAGLGRDGCAAAAETARRNHGVLVSCELAEAVATVEVRVDAPTIWRHPWEVTRKARAAPSDYVVP